MLSRHALRAVRDWTCDSRRWSNYKPRAGDVIIATAPKVGTTWMQQIACLLIFQSPDPQPLGVLSPWIDCRFRQPIEEVLPIIEAQTHRRFLKSHLPLDALPIYDEVRYIHVARDGRDACMSLLNHYNNFTAEALEGLDKVGLSDETIKQPFPRLPRTEREFFLHWIADSEKGSPQRMSDFFFNFERSFWTERRGPNLLLVHYNDLKADLSGEMNRIAEFLGITTPDVLWPKLVEAATFDAMKRDGATLMAHAERHFQGGAQSFFYKGTNNRWRDVLTDADLALYERKITAQLSPSLIHWLTEGRRSAGDPRSSPD